VNDRQLAPSLRALHLRSSGGYGGTESVLRVLLPALANLEVTVGLVVSHRPDCRTLLGPQLLRGTCWDVVDRGRFDLKLFQEITEIVRAFRPDVLHSHDYKSNLVAWWVKRTHHVPIVTTLHGYTQATRWLRVYEAFDRSRPTF
jgi:glycosyltransferase involved in cell wall biosynthesis